MVPSTKRPRDRGRLAGVIGLTILTVLVVVALIVSPERYTDGKLANGLHCLDGEHGTHPDLRERLIASLRNPSSFQHITTYIVPVDLNVDSGPAYLRAVDLTRLRQTEDERYTPRQLLQMRLHLGEAHALKPSSLNEIIMEYRARTAGKRLVISSVRATIDIEDCSAGPLSP